MGVTLRQLEVFVAVADESHFGRAAQRLHCSQPVVSQEIRRLEGAVGTTLFDRSTRTVALTEAGAALLEDARALCSAAGAFVVRARRLTDMRSRRLRIAVTPSVMDEILPVVLRRAESAMPDAELLEVPVETGEVAWALVNRECDVGLGRFVTPPPHHRSDLVRTEPVLVALSEKHPLAGEEAIDLAEMGDLPLLLWPREQNPEYYDELMRICADRGLNPLVLVSPPRIVGGRSYLIADGRAFSLIPASTAGRVSDGVRVVPLRRSATLPLSVIWLERDHRPVVMEFLDLVRQVGAEPVSEQRWSRR